MANKKSTKRALLLSALSLIMCFSLLIGSTFAWFTDSASSASNKIQAGTLKVDIVNEAGASLVGDGLFFQNKNGETDILWEPGATFRTQAFKIKNAGNLALKYRLALAGIDGDAKLLEVISFSIVKADGSAVDLENFEATLNANDELSEIYYIEGTMSTTANNDYQGKELNGIGVTVIAGQAMHENDSFDDTYDSESKYPEPESNQPSVPTFTVGTTSQLQNAMTSSKADGKIIVNIANDLELASGETWIPLNLDSYVGVSQIVINGNGHTIKGLNDALLNNAIFGNTKVEIYDLTLLNSTVNKTTDYAGAFVCYADSGISVTLKNCHVKDSTISSANYAGGLLGYTSTSLTIENCSVINCTITGSGSVGAMEGGTSTGNNNPALIVNGLIIKGNTLTSTKTGSWRVGVLSGMINIPTATLSNVITENNTCAQENYTKYETKATEWFGRLLPAVAMTGDTSRVIYQP